MYSSIRQHIARVCQWFHIRVWIPFTVWYITEQPFDERFIVVLRLIVSLRVVGCGDQVVEQKLTTEIFKYLGHRRKSVFGQVKSMDPVGYDLV